MIENTKIYECYKKGLTSNKDTKLDESIMSIDTSKLLDLLTTNTFDKFYKKELKQYLTDGAPDNNYKENAQIILNRMLKQM